MKRHLQKTGVRKFFGQDLIDLQSEPLKALDGFFAQYGACIITGCEITPAENDTFNVTSGLVAIPVVDPEIDTTAIKVMPFDGAEGVVLPLYLTAQNTIVERVYGDGRVKPIAYDFHAAASGVLPETPYITLTSNDNNRFVDVLQDEAHSFITTSERNKWNAILQLAKDYADNAASVKAEATLRTSKQYTDGKDTVLRNDMAIADATTLRSAKDYADTIVAALVDNSPEALNTLQELAAALGDNPNFATDVLQAIGERAKTSDVIAALNGKADANHGHNGVDGLNWFKADGSEVLPHHYVTARRTNDIDAKTKLYLKIGQEWHDMVCVSHADSTPWNGIYDKENATPTKAGLMSAADKERIDSLNPSELVKKAFYFIPTNANDIPHHGGDAFVSYAIPDKEIGVVFNGLSVEGVAVQLRIMDYNGRTAAFIRGNKTNVWHELYHSGNLKIIRGTVGANGEAVRGPNVYANGNTRYIYHNLEDPNVIFTGTVHANGEQGLNFEIIDKQAMYIKVGIKGISGGYYPIAFDYMITL